MRFIRTIIELVTSLWRPTPPPTDEMPTPALPGGRPPVPSTGTTEQETDNGTDAENGEREVPTPGVGGEPLWLQKARREDGTIEAPGARNNPRILEYFQGAGHSEIVSDETAWCAAFACWCLEKAGRRSPRSLMARSFLSWGKPLQRPAIGAIMVFARGDDPRFGHVGFYVGEDHDSYFILGGNQWNPKTKRSEIVNVGRQPKHKLLGIRWPVTAGNSRTVQGVTTSGTGLTLQQSAAAIPDSSAQQLTDAGTQLQLLGHVKWWLGAIGTALVIVGILWVLYARIDDIRTKGR